MPRGVQGADRNAGLLWNDFFEFQYTRVWIYFVVTAPMIAFCLGLGYGLPGLRIKFSKMRRLGKSAEDEQSRTPAAMA